MKHIQVIIALGFCAIVASVFAPSAQAIILIPALILIPIAKVVAVMMGAAAVPALGLGVLWSQLFNTPMKKVLLGVGVALAISAVVLGMYLKISTPERPLF